MPPSLDYWANEYKPQELATLRDAAKGRKADREYLELLIAHWEAGGNVDGAPPPDGRPGLKWGRGAEIEGAVEDIYLRARGERTGGTAEREYVQRVLRDRRAAAERRRTREARAEAQQREDLGPLADLL